MGTHTNRIYVWNACTRTVPYVTTYNQCCYTTPTTTPRTTIPTRDAIFMKITNQNQTNTN